MTMTTQASAADLELLRSDLWRCHANVGEAHGAMPTMTVQWFGPASRQWQRSAERYRARITALQQQAHRAAGLAQALQP